MPGNRKDLPDAKPKNSGEVKPTFSLEELVAWVEEHAGPARKPQCEGEISIKDYMRIIGCSYDHAHRNLNAMVDQGLMTKREASNGNKAPIIVFKEIGDL